MPITVFWSWQSDREPKLHHYFVRDALKLALKMLANELEFQESERPEVDHDTRGVAGTPDIASAILAKIAGASVFVADVTPVGKTVPASVRPDLVASKRPKAKYLQNPNVMSELGYADRALGQDSIILVANAAHYPGEQALPFDWRHRRGPVLFRLPSGSATPVINAERQRFAVELRDRLRPMIEAAIAASAAPPPAVERRTSKSDDPAVWEPDGSVLKMRDSFKASIERNVELLEGPRLYARIIPSSWTQKPAQTLLQRLTSDAALYVRGQNGDSGLNPDGAIRVWLAGDYTPQRAVVGTMTQWFRSDGEIWAVDTTSFGKHGEQFAFAYGLPFPRLGLFIHNALQALAGFGAGAPI